MSCDVQSADWLIKNYYLEIIFQLNAVFLSLVTHT